MVQEFEQTPAEDTAYSRLPQDTQVYRQLDKENIVNREFNNLSPEKFIELFDEQSPSYIEPKIIRSRPKSSRKKVDFGARAMLQELQPQSNNQDVLSPQFSCLSSRQN